MRSQPSFDRIAHSYRWLERLTLGSALQRCRMHFLPQLFDRHKALVLGDGDGRFLARLLAANLHLEATAIDSSAAMLDLLRNRCLEAAPRLATLQTNALDYIPDQHYDLVVTHFFLDCFEQRKLEQLTDHIVPHLAPEALWLVSDFRIPQGLLRLPAQIYIRSLYLAFRLLTGLRTTHLPDHEAALRRAGFNRVALHRSLFGLLTTEIWALR